MTSIDTKILTTCSRSPHPKLPRDGRLNPIEASLGGGGFLEPPSNSCVFATNLTYLNEGTGLIPLKPCHKLSRLFAFKLLKTYFRYVNDTLLFPGLMKGLVPSCPPSPNYINLNGGSRRGPTTLKNVCRNFIRFRVKLKPSAHKITGYTRRVRLTVSTFTARVVQGTVVSGVHWVISARGCFEIPSHKCSTVPTARNRTHSPLLFLDTYWGKS